MSRHSFRSQPALQRSGGRPPSILLGLAGLVALGLGYGAVSALQERPASGGQLYGAAALEPAGAGSVRSFQAATAAEPTPQPPPVAAAQPQLVAALAPVARKLPAKSHAARAAKPAPAQPVHAPTPQQAWEQQRDDYERAVAKYDAGERAEGYRWAQQNRIRLQRYCRAAAGRTPAFLQGCLNYVRPDGAGDAERAGALAKRTGEPG